MTNQLIFFGSAPFSPLVLQHLISANIPIKAVVTNPDKPAGRHLKLTPNPVKTLAMSHNIPVFTSPKELLNQDLINTIALVAAYGKIIPQHILDLFSGHVYNIHPSLLPKYRGPSPLQSQLLNNETQTGVTLIQLDEQMDHGPIISQNIQTISSTDTWISLGEKLFTQGIHDFINLYPQITTLPSTKQDDSQATYTKKFTKEDGFIEFDVFSKEVSSQELSPETINKFKAFYNWPSVWTLNPNNKRIKLISIAPIITRTEGE